uniref:Uncharacterized protein n=1 Tax=Rhodnius prolixus TaxID=13249 RepID=T1I9Z9_RHOPR
MSPTVKLFIILLAVVTVSGFDPIEKLNNIKDKSVAAVSQMKYKLDTFKANTKAKFDNVKYYMNYLKDKMYAKTFPYSKKAALVHEYDGYAYKVPVYPAVKPYLGYKYPGYDYKLLKYAPVKAALVQDYVGHDHKFPEYHHEHPYSFVQFQSGPDHYYKAGILH